MKRENVIRIGKIFLLALFCLTLVGCVVDDENRKESEVPEEPEQSIEQNEPEDSTGEHDNSTEEEAHILIPMKYQYQEGDMNYDPEDTIYYKTYYDDFVRGKIRHIEYPDIDIRDELEEYFLYEYDFEKWDNLVEMFFDYRTIDIPEEELKSMFCQHGYTLCFQNAKIKNLHVRFVEITEIGGLSLYPTRIMIQTWDEDYIYLQDITSPIPRKIMSFFVIDNREPYRMVVHSSGFSRDYVAEEELSFWEYRGTYWALVPMDLEIDTSHAHVMGENLYPDMDRDELFEASYYRDGIAYRPSRQNEITDSVTVRLGKMEEVEKNRIFRLMAVHEAETGTTVYSSNTYIQFEIKQDLPFTTREFRLNDERCDAYINYPQLSGFEDKEKEKRLNLMIAQDTLKILEQDDAGNKGRFTAGLDYDIKYMDDRIISILYKGWFGATGARCPDIAMVTTIDMEEEQILVLDNIIADYNALHDLLMADQFKNTTNWDGETGQFTVSQEYESKATTLMEDLNGDDGDIEWYIDREHFVIVILNGTTDYNEYAISLQDAKDFLRKDFLEMIG